MDSLDILLQTVKNSRHWLQTEKDRVSNSDNSFGIVKQKNRLAKDLFAVARFYYGQCIYEEAISYIKEAHLLAGASLESSYFLMHSLSEIGKWDDAYDAFRESRKHHAFGQNHPLYIDPDVTLANLNGLGRKVVDHCERLQKPINEVDYQDWHWNKRFLDYREFMLIAEGEYPFGKETILVYHPFTFHPVERIFEFQGLTAKDIPFRIKNPGLLEVGKEYPARVGHLVCCPQSRCNIEDAASWLVIDLI